MCRVHGSHRDAGVEWQPCERGSACRPSFRSTGAPRVRPVGVIGVHRSSSFNRTTLAPLQGEGSRAQVAPTGLALLHCRRFRGGGPGAPRQGTRHTKRSCSSSTGLRTWTCMTAPAVTQCSARSRRSSGTISEGQCAAESVRPCTPGATHVSRPLPPVMTKPQAGHTRVMVGDDVQFPAPQINGGVSRGHAAPHPSNSDACSRDTLPGVGRRILRTTAND